MDFHPDGKCVLYLSTGSGRRGVWYGVAVEYYDLVFEFWNSSKHPQCTVWDGYSRKYIVVRYCLMRDVKRAHVGRKYIKQCCLNWWCWITIQRDRFCGFGLRNNFYYNQYLALFTMNGSLDVHRLFVSVGIEIISSLFFVFLDFSIFFYYSYLWRGFFQTLCLQRIFS